MNSSSIWELRSKKSKQQVSANGRNCTLKQASFKENYASKEQSCSQSKFLLLVIKGQTHSPLFNTFLKVLFLLSNNQIFWCFYTPIFSHVWFNKFLTPEKLEWKLTVCSATSKTISTHKFFLRIWTTVQAGLPSASNF